MESAVTAPVSGHIKRVVVQEGEFCGRITYLGVQELTSAT